MNLSDRSELISYLKQHGFWAKKGLSQNFLVDKEALDKIVEAAKLKSDDTVIEVGPGVGTLTMELVKYVGRVIAIELDEKLAGQLSVISNQLTEKKKNLEIINADILKINLPELLDGKDYKVVANIPYAITSKIIRLFLTEKNKPKLMVSLVQKEVAERICAKPGDMSTLSISVQLYGEPEIVDIVKSNSFFPSPKVDSAILKISNIKESEDFEEKAFFRCVNIGFASKRKTLLNNLSAGYHLDKKTVSDIIINMGLSLDARAQELSVEEWKKLYQLIGI